MKLHWKKRRARSPQKPRRREPETVLHIAVAHYLDLALPEGFLHTCFPSGGGGAVRGAKLKARGLKAGMPDHVVFAHTGVEGYEGNTVLWLELKAKRGQPSQAQKDMHPQLRAIGHQVEVVRTLDEVEAVLAAFVFPDRLRARVA